MVKRAADYVRSRIYDDDSSEGGQITKVFKDVETGEPLSFIAKLDNGQWLQGHIADLDKVGVA